VTIGTTVRIRRIKDGGEETYTILGAWDTDPSKHIISYLAQMAQALIGKKVGDASPPRLKLVRPRSKC
jgi:transcription elongation GreA/GreB family factor